MMRMKTRPVDRARFYMQSADRLVSQAVLNLQAARDEYTHTDLPVDVKKARLAALDAKISALKDTHASPDAHPWKEDQ